MSDLLYRPDLTYDKNYYTDGSLFDQNNNDEIQSPNDSIKPIDKLEQLDNLRNEIINKLPYVPENIVNPFLPPFFVIDGVLDDIIKDSINFPIYPENNKPSIVPPSSENEDTDNNEDEDDIDNNDEIDGELGDIPTDPFDMEDQDSFIDIPVDEVIKWKELELEFKNDLMDIFEDYFIKFEHVIDRYLNESMTYLSYNVDLISIDKDNELTKISTNDIKDPNLSHLSDAIIKLRIGLNQKLKLSTKLFDIDQTILHITSAKVANEQRKRYYSNKEVGDKDLLTKFGNDLLKESKYISQKKYKENFHKLYKYLNSSVILFNECILTAAKQKKALLLLKSEERE